MPRTPSAGASSCITSGTDSGATSGSPSDSTMSLGTPSGVWGSPSGAGPGVAPTVAFVAAVTIAVATPEGEDLGKKGDKRMKPHKKGEKAEQIEVSKHPCRDVWLAGWSRNPLGPGH
jgi:hypothetical protein